MGLFDSIHQNIEAAAGKVGISPDQIKTVTTAYEANLAKANGDHVAAAKATAAQVGVPLDKVTALVEHGGITGAAGGLAGGLGKLLG